MTGQDAIQQLKDSGFNYIRTDSNGHEQWAKGEFRIMVRPRSPNLDHATEARINKLCRGGATSRDLERAAHQGKVKLPQHNYDVGTEVYHRSFPKRGAGTVVSVNFGQAIATISWKQAKPEPWISYKIPLVELTSVKPTDIDIEPSKEEVKPMEEERTEEKRTVTGTILDQLVALEMAMDAEKQALTAMAERVAAYQRLEKLQGELGIEVKPLPFVLVFREEEKVVAAVAVAEEIAEEEAEPAPAPTLISRNSDPAAVSEEEIIEVFETADHPLSNFSIGQRFKGRSSQARAVVESLVSAGRLVEDEGDPDAAGRVRKVFTLAGSN